MSCASRSEITMSRTGLFGVDCHLGDLLAELAASSWERREERGVRIDDGW